MNEPGNSEDINNLACHWSLLCSLVEISRRLWLGQTLKKLTAYYKRAIADENGLIPPGGDRRVVLTKQL